MGCISLCVCFGFVRIESESEAVRRRGVCALGFREEEEDEDDEPCDGGVHSEA